MPKRILLVEDEPGMTLILSDRIRNEGYELDTAEDGDSGYRMALENEYDLIILDIMLPGKSGFDICRELRKNKIITPILMLTARRDLVDKVLGLKIGADDYLTKPFEIFELLARIEALIRRGELSSRKKTHSYSFGNISVDFNKAEVTVNGEPVELSTREFQLLRYFIENKGVLLTRDQLLDEVWGYDAMPVTRTVDVHIAGLRQKLELNPRKPQYILTVHGSGYKFVG